MRFFAGYDIINLERKTRMKYLFFDIECSSVSKNAAKICAFGYCLTDEQFNIIEKEDILINPQGGFHLTDRKGEQGLVLPYQYGEFKKYPTFPQKADKIYALLQDTDTLVVGHAAMNDVKYLNLESKRFSLAPLSFSFADTQFIYMNVVGEYSRQFGLGAIAQELGVSFTAHRAVDDAYATMKVAQALCEKHALSLPALIEKYQITLGKIENFEITQSDSTAFSNFRAAREKAKEERERARAQFHIFADRAKRRRAKDGVLKGKTICFSHAVELDTERAQALLVAAFAQAARLTYRAEECDLYVCYENESGARLKSVQERGTRVLTPEQFAEILKTL